MSEERALADVAASVADGVAVDWDAARSRATPTARRLMRHLRLVESIASLHRTIPDEGASEQDVSPAEPTGPLWGRLIMLERIGEGASCEVFRAWDSELRREVALKLLDDDGDRSAHARLLAEARRLARVRHEHVVHIYGAERHDSRVGLWMELVHGESLAEIVESRGLFGAREAALVGLDLCAALAAVHSTGLVHRDVKPQNVMREAGGRIVLMDFGMGEELRENAGSSRLVGTPLYLAPEIFSGAPATVQSDLYSLGVLLFHLVTGAYPVPAASMEGLARAHASQTLQRLRDLRPDLPRGFVRAVERALEPDPSDRYGSAGEMESALRHALERPLDSGAEAHLGGRQWAAWAGAALLLALVVAVIVWTRPPPSAIPPLSLHRIAVLPFAAVSQEEPAGDLAEALTDGLIAALGQISSLRVTPRTSIAAYEGAGRAEIAAALGVDAVVEGSVAVEQDGSREAIRVDVRIVAVGAGTPAWTQMFAGHRGHLAGLQSDIARAIAGAVRASVTEEEAARLARVGQTSPAAEEAYLQGRLHLVRYGPGPARRALAAFERAVGLDPAHAAAFAGIARAYVTLGMHGAIPHPEARALALGNARKAADLDDQLADAHAVLADIQFFYDWDWQGAERSYRRSLDLNPSFTRARAYYAQFLAAAGRFDEALRQEADARALDPDSVEGPPPGMLLYYKRDYQAAESAMLGGSGRELLLGRVVEAQGRIDEAFDLTRRAAEREGRDAVPLAVQLIRLHALAGHRVEADDALTALKHRADARLVRLNSRDLAYVRLAFGDTAAALALFEQAVDERDPTLVWLGVDPRVDPLRERPAFQAILQRIGFR